MQGQKLEAALSGWAANGVFGPAIQTPTSRLAGAWMLSSGLSRRRLQMFYSFFTNTAAQDCDDAGQGTQIPGEDVVHPQRAHLGLLYVLTACPLCS